MTTRLRGGKISFRKSFGETIRRQQAFRTSPCDKGDTSCLAIIEAPSIVEFPVYTLWYIWPRSPSFGHLYSHQ